LVGLRLSLLQIVGLDRITQRLVAVHSHDDVRLLVGGILHCILAEGAVPENLRLIVTGSAIELVVELAEEVQQLLWRLREAVYLQLVVDALDSQLRRLARPNLGATDLEANLEGLDFEEVITEAIHYLMELYLVLSSKDLEEFRVRIDDLAATLRAAVDGTTSGRCRACL